MEKSKKKLPTGDAPINYLMRFYVPLMIAFLNPAEVEGWFYSSYILTKVRKKTHKLWMIFQNFNPFIIRIPFFIMSSMLLSENALFKIIKKIIDDNWYISVSVDFFYIKETSCFKKTHYDHAVLLYGYDFTKNIVHLRGYGFGPKIKSIDINFDDFAASFFSCKHNKVWIYRRRNRREKGFDKRFFYLGVKGYATATCPLEYQIRAKSFSAVCREYYGIEAHVQLKQDLVDVLNGAQKNLKLRIYSYWELAACMVERINYMQKHNLLHNVDELKNGFVMLSKDYKSMLYLFMKYELTGKVEIIKKIIELENMVYDKEKELFLILYDTTKKQFNYK